MMSAYIEKSTKQIPDTRAAIIPVKTMITYIKLAFSDTRKYILAVTVVTA